MIIGTAGHIDHGKTTLVQALTGVDTDRLPEEKRRGITIDLGFAYLPLSDGQVLGFVDVPGHEKFVHTMTAGASSIDHALLVIAADDGIMPQTREHLTIVQFMGVRGLTVALSKIDRVSADVVQQRLADIQMLLSNTAFHSSPIFPVATLTGQGIAALREHLLSLAVKQPVRVHAGVRYSIDRCFILPGSGVTVSGLLHSGSLKAGDILTLSPMGLSVRIRSIHAQNRAVEHAQAGERCGLVLVGVEKAQIERGDWLLSPELHQPVERFDAYIDMAAENTSALAEGVQVMLHHGARRCPTRLVLLNKPKLVAQDQAFIQCCLETPLPVFWHDRLVLRDMSGQRTLAGGWVLDIDPPLRGRKQPQRWSLLQALLHTQASEALSHLVALQETPLALSAWAIAMNQPLAELTAALRARLPDLLLLNVHQQVWVLTAALAERLQTLVLERLQQFHIQHADEPGVASERLRRMSLPALKDEVFDALIDYCLGQQVLKRSGSFIHLPEHRVELTAQEQTLWVQVEPLLQAGGFEPPWVRDLAKQTGIAESVIRHLLGKQARRGELHQVVADLFYTPQQIRQLATKVREQTQPFQVMAFRDSLGIGRKRTIQLLEFFDRVGFTRRIVGEGMQGKKRDSRSLRNAQLFLPE